MVGGLNKVIVHKLVNHWIAEILQQNTESVETACEVSVEGN